MDVYEKMKWGLLFLCPIKRLNIVSDAPVSKAFVDNLTFIGRSDYGIMNEMFDEEELKTITWYWKSQKVFYPESVYLFRAPVEQHLRFGRRKSLHYEDWVIGIFDCSDGIYRVCPLKRDSDFAENIFEILNKKTSRDDVKRFPWKPLDFFETFGFKKSEVVVLDSPEDFVALIPGLPKRSR